MLAGINNPAAAQHDPSNTNISSEILLDGKRWTVTNLDLVTPDSYCYEDQEANCRKYGRLYTWEAAKRGCEMLGNSWRLPTNEEWRAMAAHYGGIREEAADGGKTAYKKLLKKRKAKFRALLSGGRDADGEYKRLNAHGFYWTSTGGKTGEAWFYNFGKGSKILNRHPDGEQTGAFAVRCLQD